MTTATLKLVANTVGIDAAAAIAGLSLPMAAAATAAIHRAGESLKTRGRANIGAAGFSKRWQNAWRVNYYPRSGNSMNAAVWAKHNIPYSGIYETGGTIRGRHGLLWIPLPTVPNKRGSPGGTKQMRPKEVIAAGVKMFTIKRPGKHPILAARGSFGVTKAGVQGKITISKLVKGSTKRKSRTRAQIKVVPLFVGIPSVSVRKRFNISGIADRERAALPGYYDEALKVN